MSSIPYIEKTIAELDSLVRGVLTGTRNLERENKKYEGLRRRVLALEALVGSAPGFIKDSPDLWKLWNNHVKAVLTTYDSRRDFLDKYLVQHYEHLLSTVTTGTFEQELLKRDIALLDEVGSGGFGVVYAADHIVLDESRAIKKLEPLFADAKDEEKALRRFSREIQILYKVAHHSIVRIYDAGMAGNFPFIVMEFVDGDNLMNFVAKEGPLDLPTARTIMLQITDAVAKAHEFGVVHRDIKPTNIMWDGTRAVLLDFGAGQWVEHQLSTRMTTGLIGTSGYIADELQSNPTLIANNLDCYSLGVVFHYLLTGRTPNLGDPTHYMNEAEVAIIFQKIILKALSPAPKRYKDGRSLHTAIFNEHP